MIVRARHRPSTNTTLTHLHRSFKVFCPGTATLADGSLIITVSEDKLQQWIVIDSLHGLSPGRFQQRSDDILQPQQQQLVRWTEDED